jgi:hypothetical protein
MPLTWLNMIGTVKTKLCQKNNFFFKKKSKGKSSNPQIISMNWAFD